MIMFHVLNKMVYEERRWVDFLSLTTLPLKHTSTQVTAFSSVYRAEAVVPIKIMVPSARLAPAYGLTDPHDRIYDVEALEKRRFNLKREWLLLKANQQTLQQKI